MRLNLEQACHVCGKPTSQPCDQCEKPHCYGCLYKSGETLTFDSDPHNENYEEHPTWSRAEEICLACFLERKKRAPLALREATGTEAQINASVLINPEKARINAGSSSMVDDLHSWESPPYASAFLTMRWGSQNTIEWDIFQSLQLLEFLKAHEETIRAHAKAVSDVLVPYEQEQTKRAHLADLGIYRNLLERGDW